METSYALRAAFFGVLLALAAAAPPRAVPQMTAADERFSVALQSFEWEYIQDGDHVDLMCAYVSSDGWALETFAQDASVAGIKPLEGPESSIDLSVSASDHLALEKFFSGEDGRKGSGTRTPVCFAAIRGGSDHETPHIESASFKKLFR